MYYRFRSIMLRIAAGSLAMVAAALAADTTLETALTPKAKALVKEFMLLHQSELLKMWEDGKGRKLPPLA